MASNLIKELEPNLIKRGDATYSSIEICISQNKIFGFLFLSQFIPKIDQVIKKFQTLYNAQKSNDYKLTLIIIICDEEKYEYDLVLTKISDLTCFIVPFESNFKDKIFKNYNIISLPTLAIFDKNGKILEFCSNLEIFDIDIDTINGWYNKFNIVNELKVSRSYNIGDIGFIPEHRHDLIYSDYLVKMPNYSKGNWYCDICQKSFNKEVPNFYCDLCSYDVCDSCYEKRSKNF